MGHGISQLISSNNMICWSVLHPHLFCCCCLQWRSRYIKRCRWEMQIAGRCDLCMYLCHVLAAPKTEFCFTLTFTYAHLANQSDHSQVQKFCVPLLHPICFYKLSFSCFWFTFLQLLTVSHLSYKWKIFSPMTSFYNCYFSMLCHIVLSEQDDGWFLLLTIFIYCFIFVYCVCFSSASSTYMDAKGRLHKKQEYTVFANTALPICYTYIL